MIFATIFVTALIFKGRLQNTEPFLLELPPYRFPTPRQIWLRGWQEARHFLNRASTFIIIGVVLVWALTNYPMDVAPASSATIAGHIGDWLAPVLSPIGIDSQLAIALIFEIGRAPCRERGCQYVDVSGVGVQIKKKKST